MAFLVTLAWGEMVFLAFYSRPVSYVEVNEWTILMDISFFSCHVRYALVRGGNGQF